MMNHAYSVSGRASTTLDIYLRDIKHHELLSAAEEIALAEAIAAGDSDARARMIRSNLRLVVRIARDYAGRGLSLDDLIGEGNLGLIRAAQEYNPSFGTRFSTYASYWIKQAIRHAFTNTTAAIRLPAHMVGLLTKWRRAERSLARELGQSPTEDQIAVHLGLTDSQVRMVRKARLASRLQFENGLVSNDESWSPDESIDDREPPDASLEADDERRQMLQRLNRLDDRERGVIVMRFGLEGGEPMTLKDVGQRLGITREWVRKIELRAIKKLNEPVSEVSSATVKSRRSRLSSVATTSRTRRSIQVRPA